MADKRESDADVARFKIGIIGEPAVGKSCLLVKWVDGDFFDEKNRETLGFESKSKSVKVGNEEVKVLVYDTAGQERYRTVTASFYRGMKGVILTFDLSSKESFSRLSQWLDDVGRYQKVNVVLVGNKSDLGKKAVTDDEVKEFVKNKKIDAYFETSAKTGENVDAAFAKLAEAMVKNGAKPAPPVVAPNPQPTTGKKCIIL